MRITSEQKHPEASLGSCLIGFASSIFLTTIAYLLVVDHRLKGWVLVFTIASLALTQCLVQLLCFLHLGHETKPRYKLSIFVFMLIIILVLVFGSIWIMSNLNYRMTKQPSDINQYLHDQDGI